MISLRSIAAIAIAVGLALPVTATLAQDSDNWTANGPVDYSKLHLQGKQVVWSDLGGTVRQTYEKAYFPRFEALTGIKVVTGSVFDYARVKAQVESGKVTEDIITGASFVIKRYCGTLFEKVPDTKVYRGYLDKKYISSECGIPQSAPKFIVMYNTQMYGDKKPASCADFFDLTKFPGKRALWSTVIGNALEIALMGDGVPLKDVYPLNVDRALAKLATIKSDTVYYPNQAAVTQGMINGEYGMAVLPSPSAYDNVQAGAPFAPLWNCGVEQTSTLGILKGTPDLDAALALVGFVATPETQSARMAVTAHSPITKTFTLPDQQPLRDFIEGIEGTQEQFSRDGQQLVGRQFRRG
jgi:putative spermidine/putrescine transport system substrate-binding protein